MLIVMPITLEIHRSTTNTPPLRPSLALQQRASQGDGGRGPAVAATTHIPVTDNFLLLCGGQQQTKDNPGGTVKGAAAMVNNFLLISSDGGQG